MSHTWCVQTGSCTLLQTGSSRLGIAGPASPLPLLISQKHHSTAECSLCITVNANFCYIHCEKRVPAAVNTLKNYSAEPAKLSLKALSYCPELVHYKMPKHTWECEES